jgi:hypothetical protein
VNPTFPDFYNSSINPGKDRILVLANPSYKMIDASPDTRFRGSPARQGESFLDSQNLLGCLKCGTADRIWCPRLLETTSTLISALGAHEVPVRGSAEAHYSECGVAELTKFPNVRNQLERDPRSECNPKNFQRAKLVAQHLVSNLQS